MAVEMWITCFIFSIMLLNLSASNVTCNTTNECKTTTITCQSYEDCFISCSGYASCKSASIICPINYKCSVECSASYACAQATIDALSASQLTLDCITDSTAECLNMKITCPPNINGHKKCKLSGGNSLGGTIQYYMDIYSIYSWNDIDFSGCYGNLRSNPYVTMHCADDTSSCVRATNQWTCAHSNDLCNNPPTLSPIPTIKPTSEPTYPPTLAPIPTIKPTSEPTYPPTYIPTIFPTFNPTENPIFIPVTNVTVFTSTNHNEANNEENVDTQYIILSFVMVITILFILIKTCYKLFKQNNVDTEISMCVKFMTLTQMISYLLCYVFWMICLLLNHEIVFNVLQYLMFVTGWIMFYVFILHQLYFTFKDSIYKMSKTYIYFHIFITISIPIWYCSITLMNE
eukprot:247690_1